MSETYGVYEHPDYPGVRYRIVTERDQDAENPRMWETMVGALNVCSVRGVVDILDGGHTFPGDLLGANERLWHITGYPQRRLGCPPKSSHVDNAGIPWRVESIPTGMYWARDNDTIVRWARIFHGAWVEFWDKAWWWVDRAEFEASFPDVPYDSEDGIRKQHQIIVSEQATYQQWQTGGVAVVVLERQVHWQRVDENGEPVRLTEPTHMETWEAVEAIGGCYLDDDYTPLVVAREHWLYDDERDTILKKENETDE